jgi:hypothetical protein
MKRLMLLIFLISVLGYRRVSSTAPAAKPAAPASPEQAFVDQYCAACHNDKARPGGFSFSQVDLLHPEKNAEEGEKIILKLNTGLMPPSGSPRPSSDALKAFVSTLESRIDASADAHPNPGKPLLHRLNRAEYRNSVRDILDLNIDAEALLPADSITQGFDNLSESLTVTPTLMDAYVAAAGKIARLAVGDTSGSPTGDTFRLPTNFSQIRHVEGTPLGTRGGIAVVYNFPADAEYVFKSALVFTRNTLLFGSTIAGEQLEIALNGERVALFDIDPLMKGIDNNLQTPPVPVKAGPQSVSASFVTKGDGPIDDFLYRPERSLGDDFVGQTPGLTGPPHLRELGIVGPYNSTGLGDTPSRRRIFSCHPETRSQEEPCARKILSALALKAFRKPVTPPELQDLMGAYADGYARGGFDSGVRLALQFILASPEFVFRFERTPANAAPGANYPLGDIELASRLSYFLWSSIPDEELLSLASQSKLRNPDVLRQQVHRMLADPRSESLAANFAMQWLHLRNLKNTNPDVYLYPDSDDNLFQSMQRETELFFDSIVRENRTVLDLLTANYTFVDERLAKHYGIPNVMGNRFRRVSWADSNRFGLLGQGSVLTVTSLPNRTSPVARGKWVLEQILGVSPPPPPPVVPRLVENNVIGGETIRLRSVRDRMEEHRGSEPCRSCHKIMDPIGLALENFDAVGAWRLRDSGHPVDAAGELTDGTRVDGPDGLRTALLNHSDAFVTNLTEKLFAYGLGRVVSTSDMPFVRKAVRDAGPNRRFESIVLGIVNSVPFQMTRKETN